MNMPISFSKSQLGNVNIRMQSEILHLLHDFNFSVFRNIEVEASDEAVTIRGRLRSFYDKQVALTHSLRVVGHRKLIDEIVVEKEEIDGALAASPRILRSAFLP